MSPYGVQGATQFHLGPNGEGVVAKDVVQLIQKHRGAGSLLEFFARVFACAVVRFHDFLRHCLVLAITEESANRALKSGGAEDFFEHRHHARVAWLVEHGALATCRFCPLPWR